MRQVLTAILIVAVVGAGLCVLDDHAGADLCLALVAVAVAVTATITLVVALGEAPAPAAGWPRSFPHQARPAPI